MQYSVDKIGGFARPPRRYLLRLDLHLLAQNLVAYFPPIPPIIGSPAQHELIGNNPNRIVINREGMILPAHDFGCHITGRAARIAAVVGLHHPGYAQIGDPEIAHIVEYKVLGLYVSVDYIMEMQEL